MLCVNEGVPGHDSKNIKTNQIVNELSLFSKENPI